MYHRFLSLPGLSQSSLIKNNFGCPASIYEDYHVTAQKSMMMSTQSCIKIVLFNTEYIVLENLME
jgi:hypothetical protein